MLGTPSESYRLLSKKGFFVDKGLSNEEYLIARKYINNQWIKILSDYSQDIASLICDNDYEIFDYPKISSFIDHSNVWNKLSRILPIEFSDWFQSSSFYSRITSTFGPFVVSDEEHLGYPNFYWRLVRPYCKSDVGPLHKDSWFWSISDNNHGYDMASNHRIKCWVDIITVPSKNGLLLLPLSHRDTSIKWTPVKRHGTLKPQIQSSIPMNDLIMPETAPGSAIFFHDDLLHGGSFNQSNSLRVSFEFTIIAKNTAPYAHHY